MPYFQTICNGDKPFSTVGEPCQNSHTAPEDYTKILDEVYKQEKAIPLTEQQKKCLREKFASAVGGGGPEEVVMRYFCQEIDKNKKNNQDTKLQTICQKYDIGSKLDELSKTCNLHL